VRSTQAPTRRPAPASSDQLPAAATRYQLPSGYGLPTTDYQLLASDGLNATRYPLPATRY